MSMTLLIDLLHEGNYSCVIAQGATVRTFTQRGVADLYDLLHHEPEFLMNAKVADKVIGKGAAALIIQGGVSQVHADVMSEPAMDLFAKAGVEAAYGRLVPHIINRDQTDWCPLEKSCHTAETVSEIIPLVNAFVARIRGLSMSVVFWVMSVMGSSLFAQKTLIDTLSIPEVVVTGTRSEVDARHLPMSVSVVSRAQIDARHEPSLLPVLTEQVPGFFSTARGILGYGVSTGAAGGMSMRGIGGSPTTGMLVLIDGHPQYMGLMGHPIADAYQSMMAGRVEVVRGPASLLYGSNAMGGVINIITKPNDRDALTGYGRAGYGTFNTTITEAGASYRKNRLSALMSAMYNRTDGHRDRMAFEQYGGYGKMGYDFSKVWKAFVDVNLTHFNASNPGSIHRPLFDNDSRITRGMASASVENCYEHASGAVKLFYNWGRHQIDDGYVQGVQPKDYLFRSTDRMAGVSLYETILLWGNSGLTVGVDYMQFGGTARNVFFSGAETLLVDRIDHETAGYAQWRQNIGEVMTLHAGIRYDHHSHVGDQWVPQAGASFYLLPNGELKLVAAKGFRNPTIRELFMFPPQNADLRPETLWNYELSWSQRLWQGRLSYGVNFFMTEGDNMIQTLMQEGRPQNVNVGTVSNRGAELTAAYRVSRSLSLSGNYSLLRMGNPVLAAPGQKMFAGIDYVSRQWRASTGVQHVSGLHTSMDPVVKEAFMLWNLRGSYLPTRHIELYLKLENLLDEIYEINSGFPMPGMTGMGGVIFNF